jgi:hypothetical protein
MKSTNIIGVSYTINNMKNIVTRVNKLFNNEKLLNKFFIIWKYIINS